MSAPRGGQGRLRVLQVITTLTTGGAERQLESYTARSRHDHSVVCLYGGGAVADAMHSRGQSVQVLGMQGWRKPAAVPRLAAQIRARRPDLVHVHLLSAQLWGIPAARLARVPLVVSSEHSLMETTIEGRRRTPALRRLYLSLEALSTHTVAVSQTTARRLTDWGVPAHKISVVDNGIDFSALAPSSATRNAVRRQLGIAPTDSVVGAVGRLEPVKRIDVLVRALAPLLRQPGSVLLVVGDGPLRAQLSDLATSLGVEHSVRLLGPRPDVPRLLNALDVLVSPSRDETFGMAVIEALGNGLPVVYAQCPALEELSAPPPWAYRLTASSAAAEEADLRHAVSSALASGAGRQPLPPELNRRYGIASSTEALDRLYDDLWTAHHRPRHLHLHNTRAEGAFDGHLAP